MDNLVKTEKIYTILEINYALKELIRTEFPDYIWVCGEIKDLRINKHRKHINFSLVQKHPEANEIIAQIKAVIYQNLRPKLSERFQAEISCELKEGVEVKVLCRLNLYPRAGSYKLEVFDIDPVYTLGKLARMREKIIEDLKRKGILFKNKTLSLPPVPLNIGLITSFNSAAYHDFISELKKSGFGFKVFFFDSHMQGKNVEGDLTKALRFFNSLDKKELDLIVITRGGGSTADLSWFDSQKIAEEVAQSKFPILSAIGHEINLSVLELASHSYFKTPTKVARFIIERIEQFFLRLEELSRLLVEKASLNLERKAKSLELKTAKLERLIHSYFIFHKERITEARTLLKSLSFRSLVFKSRNLEREFLSFKMNLDLQFQVRKKSLNSLEDKLKLLDPRTILKRGFSITLKDKKALKDIKDLSLNDVVRTYLYTGEFLSRVEKLEDQTRKD